MIGALLHTSNLCQLLAFGLQNVESVNNSCNLDRVIYLIHIYIYRIAQNFGGGKQIWQNPMNLPKFTPLNNPSKLLQEV